MCTMYDEENGDFMLAKILVRFDYNNHNNPSRKTESGILHLVNLELKHMYLISSINVTRGHF